MKNFKLFGLLFLMFSILFISCKEDEIEETNETIKIGAIFPLTLEGAEASSQSRVNAIKLAVEEINAAGGVMGKELEVIVKDNKYDSILTVTRTKELIDEGCIAIIGPSTSGMSIIAAEQVTIPNNILLITPSGTSPKITDIDDNNLLWRTAPSDAFQGNAAANYAYNILGKKTAGILYTDSYYGNGLATEFTNSWIAAGGTIINNVSYESQNDYSSVDFTNAVNQLFEGNPELIYLITQSEDGIKILNTISANIDLSYFPQILGCDGNHSNDFLPPNTPSDIANGIIGFQPTSASDDTNNQTFTTNYKNKFGENPASAYAANAYDAAYLIAYAILKSNSVVPSEIAAKLVDVSATGEIVNVNDFTNGSNLIKNGTDIDYEGASGSLTLDGNGDVVTGTYTVWKIENDQFVDLTTITYP